MIASILYKFIPWYFDIAMTQQTIDNFAALAGVELFIEIVALIVFGVTGAISLWGILEKKLKG